MTNSKDGTFITGLYLEAACYDRQKKIIVEAQPRVLYDKMPVLELIPVVGLQANRDDVYECPCYRTLARFG